MPGRGNNVCQEEGGGTEAAADAPAAAPAETASESGAAATAEDEISYLNWAARSLGWVYGLVFLGLSFVLVALFVMNLLTARRENVVPAELIEGFEQNLDAKQYQEAYDLAKADDSFLGHVLSAGLGKVSDGYSQSLEAMQEVGEEENMRLEHRLSYLALIGTLSPMIGLLGTVNGMIDSFKLIANTQSGAPDAQALAQGISTALFTTFIGLAIADSSSGRVQHPAQPRCPIGAGGRHRQREPHEPISQAHRRRQYLVHDPWPFPATNRTYR